MQQGARDGGVACQTKRAKVNAFNTDGSTENIERLTNKGIKSVSTNLIFHSHPYLEHHTFSHPMEWQ